MDYVKNVCFEANFKAINDRLLKPNKLVERKDKFKEIQKLFSCFDFNDLKIKNHFLYINLNDNMFYDELGIPKNEYLKFYNNIINSGVGTIITGGVFCYKNKSNQTTYIDIDSTYSQYIHSKCVKNAHLQGVNIFLQLKSIYGRGDDCNKLFSTYSLSSSYNVNANNSNSICLRISDYRCNEIIENFVKLAKFSQTCGYDGILINGEVDNIVGEFSSNYFNNRKFGYFADYYELSKNIISKIKSNCKNINILYSITIDECLFDVFDDNIKDIRTIKNIKKKTKKYILKLITELAKCGVSGFIFKFGCYENSFLNIFNFCQNDGIFEEFYKEFAVFLNNISSNNKIYNIYIDNFSSLKQAAKLCENEIIDFVDISKNVLSDNLYLKNLIYEKENKPCIKCSHCNKISINYNRIECLVNPNLLGENLEISLKNKKVAVVGSGISGLMCANYLADRGFFVELFDVNDSINKNGKLCEVFGFDNKLQKFNNFIENQTNNNILSKKIKLFLNQKFKADNLNNEYESIIIATGFCERMLNLNGSVLKNVKSIYDALSNYSIFENLSRVSLFAKTELSLKLAVYLLLNKKKVSLIISNFDLLKNISIDKFSYYFYQLKKLGAFVYIDAKVNRIEQDFIELIINNKYSKQNILSLALNLRAQTKYPYEAKIINIDSDIFIYEPDLYSNNKLYYDIVSSNYLGKIYMIGNALEINDLAEDIKSAYFVAKNL